MDEDEDADEDEDMDEEQRERQEREELERSLQFEVLVSRVCRRWRDIALGTPALWTLIAMLWCRLFIGAFASMQCLDKLD